jgi:hypothetical protein
MPAQRAEPGVATQCFAWRSRALEISHRIRRFTKQRQSDWNLSNTAQPFVFTSAIFVVFSHHLRYFKARVTRSSRLGRGRFAEPDKKVRDNAGPVKGGTFE